MLSFAVTRPDQVAFCYFYPCKILFDDYFNDSFLTLFLPPYFRAFWYSRLSWVTIILWIWTNVKFFYFFFCIARGAAEGSGWQSSDRARSGSCHKTTIQWKLSIWIGSCQHGSWYDHFTLFTYFRVLHPLYFFGEGIASHLASITSYIFCIPLISFRIPTVEWRGRESKWKWTELERLGCVYARAFFSPSNIFRYNWRIISFPRLLEHTQDGYFSLFQRETCLASMIVRSCSLTGYANILIFYA